MTLTPEFLPVGSTVSKDNKPYIIKASDIQRLECAPKTFNYECQPIPLTPEILMEWCKSEKVQFIKCKENSAGNVWMPFIDNIGLTELTLAEYKGKGFKYRNMDINLHQLQHLYSALTQTVLPITIK